MLENQTTILAILEEEIESNQNKIDKLENQTPEILIKYKEELNKLKEDINYLTDINFEVIKEILSESKCPIELQEKIYNYLKAMSQLLKLNKYEHTSYRLDSSQLKYYNLFFNQVNSIDNETNKVVDKEEVDSLKEINNLYINLLDQIKDSSNTTYIENFDLIKNLLSACEINEKTKREIYFNLMRYNKECYNA